MVSNLGRVKSLARTRAGKSGGRMPVPERILKGPPSRMLKLRDQGYQERWRGDRLRDAAFPELPPISPAPAGPTRSKSPG